MTVLAKRVARWAAAIVLLVAGLLLSVPGIPGPGLLIALFGLFLLLPESRWLRKKYVGFKRRHPRLFTPIERHRWRARTKRMERLARLHWLDRRERLEALEAQEAPAD